MSEDVRATRATTAGDEGKRHRDDCHPEQDGCAGCYQQEYDEGACTCPVFHFPGGGRVEGRSNLCAIHGKMVERGARPASSAPDDRAEADALAEAVKVYLERFDGGQPGTVPGFLAARAAYWEALDTMRAALARYAARREG